MPAPALSVVVPVFDEERVLPATLAALVPFLEGLGRTFEVVFVDDGSRDRSRELLQAAARDDGRLVVEALPANQGKGAAVRTGVLASSGEAVAFLDADLSTPLEELPPFLEELAAGADVVLGSRRMAGAEITRRQPWLRETLGKGFTLMARTLLASGIDDFTCGFKAFRRSAADAVFSRSSLAGWAFDAELVVIARAQGLDVRQLPVRWHHEDDTKVRLAAAVVGSAIDVLRILWRRVTGRYR